MLALLVAFGLFFVVQGIATAAFLAQSDGMHGPLRVVSVGLGIFLAFIGLWFAANARRRLRGPDAAIVIGPAGLHDRLISDRPIPWAEIRNLHVHAMRRGGSVIAFDLADDARSDIHRWPRLGAPVNRLFGYGYYVLVMGTDASVDKLAAAIAPHAGVAPDAAVSRARDA